MDVRRMRNEALGKRVVKALESRNMEAYYASTKEEAVQKALELMEEGLRLTYQETSLTGMEGTTTNFEVSGPQVILRRVGSVNSQMVFEEGRQHTSLYETPYGELSVDIQTSALRHNLSDRGGLLEIRYSIAVEHTVTGRNSFKIRVKRKN